MSQFRKNVSYLNSSGRQSGDKGNAAADILPDTDEAAVLLPILSHIACLYLCICVIHKNIGFKLHWVSHPELVKSVESTATNSVARHENIIYASDFQSVGRDPLVDHQRILCGARKHADVVGTGISANADGELIDLSEDSSPAVSRNGLIAANEEFCRCLSFHSPCLTAFSWAGETKAHGEASKAIVGSTEELPNDYSGHIVILTAKKDLRAPSLAPEDFEELRRITFPVLQRA
ncbi:hypothetical protein T02_11436 [Trichinella nativa]|uniref:Uncharacterized protein n=1 Tax=Trichinella nativa TaxID=6335 RepID=A0A0V1LE46_9BILA|nr:hypothetical protein T02_11436 [Trichinella nativa]